MASHFCERELHACSRISFECSYVLSPGIDAHTKNKKRGRRGRRGGGNGVPVLIHVKDLCADEERHVVHADRDQDFVSPTVKRFVVVAVNLGLSV